MIRLMHMSVKNKIFATTKNGVILFNIENDVLPIRVAERTKTIGGRLCGNYNRNTIYNFISYLTDEKINDDINRCLYVDLLIRREVLEKKEHSKITWILPEAYSIFNEDIHRKEILKLLK